MPGPENQRLREPESAPLSWCREPSGDLRLERGQPAGGTCSQGKRQGLRKETPALGMTARQGPLRRDDIRPKVKEAREGQARQREEHM